MIAQILAHVHLLNLAIFGFNLVKDLLVEIVIMLLQHALRDWLRHLTGQNWRAVQIVDQNGLANLIL